MQTSQFFRFGLLALLMLLIASPRLLRAQQVQEGMASYYNDKFHGRKTASGEPYDKNRFTCAHRTLPFGTIVKVTNLTNGRYVSVKVNDRGPHKPERIVDLSRAAAQQIGLVQAGVARVRVEVVRNGQVSPPGNQPVVTNNPSPAPAPPRTRPARQVDISDLPIVDHNGVPIAESVQAGESQPEDQVTATPEAKPDPTLVEAQKYTPALFTMQAAKSTSEGFGLQVGAFFSFYRLLEGMDEIAGKGYKNTLVHSSIKDGKPIFRIILGPYPTRADANALRRAAAKKGVEGIVVDLKELK